MKKKKNGVRVDIADRTLRSDMWGWSRRKINNDGHRRVIVTYLRKLAIGEVFEERTLADRTVAN